MNDEFNQILELLYQGKTNSDIAKILDISKRTVERRLNKLFLKYKVQNRVELVREYQAELLN